MLNALHELGIKVHRILRSWPYYSCSLTPQRRRMAHHSQHGYPSPGTQYVTVDDIMNNLFFLSDDQWNIERRQADYDYVIIGSSFCALAFVDRALNNNPDAKIMIIERGPYFHPEHFQNLPPAFVTTVGGTSETFPWKITKETHEGQYIKWQHGMNNFFGGRSSFWSGWCPEPEDHEMSEWPAETKEVVHRFFPAAKKLLNVTPADEICKKEEGSDPIFGTLQCDIQEMLKDLPSQIAAITRTMPAPLAVGAQMYRNADYQKYSVPGPMLGTLLISRLDQEKVITKESSLKIMINCLVKKIHHNKGKACVLETSNGDFVLGNAKIILAMGTLPPTTLMLNSFSKVDFPLITHIGERFTAHFISSIIARAPANVFKDYTKFGNMEMAAMYVAGKEKGSGHQFHIQLSAIYDSNPWENIYDTIRHLPDIVAAPSIQQLLTSKEHVVFVCAVLGELDYDNSQNWFRMNEGPDITTNVTLQIVANSIDNQVWDTMDEATFQMLDILAPLDLQYWHSHDGSDGAWETHRPATSSIRVPGLVHEASTMWLGKEKGAPVDLDYRFKGVENVYLTGASLWPTGGSWNPTCAMAGMAMHLADQICPQNQ